MRRLDDVAQDCKPSSRRAVGSGGRMFGRARCTFSSRAGHRLPRWSYRGQTDQTRLLQLQVFSAGWTIQGDNEPVRCRSCACDVAIRWGCSCFGFCRLQLNYHTWKECPVRRDGGRSHEIDYSAVPFRDQEQSVRRQPVCLRQRRHEGPKAAPENYLSRCPSNIRLP